MKPYAKYIFTQNPHAKTRYLLTKCEGEAIQGLQSMTGLDLSKAVLVSVEVGTSVILEHSCSEYIRLFDYLPPYTRVIYGKSSIESVEYYTRTGSHSFKAYDKIKEMQSKRQDIPELYKDTSVLRLEYTIKRQGIKKKFNKDIILYDICDKSTYEALKALFYEFYRKIPKTGREIFLEKGGAVTPSNLEKLLAECFRQKCPEEYKDLIGRLEYAGMLTDKSKERIKAQERKNAKNYTFSDVNKLIVELDGKIDCRAVYGA